MSPDVACCSVSDWRQKEHLDDWEMAHQQMFLRVGRVLLRYLIEKFKMFLGMFCSTIDQMPIKF